MTKYHKSLVRQLVNTTANGDVKTLTNLQFMLGFTDHQISQVAENLKVLFTLSDVYQFVEIWDKRHAVKILSVINDVFKDVQEDNQSHCLPSEGNNDDYVFDEELLDEWNEILQDEELLTWLLTIYRCPNCTVQCVKRNTFQMDQLMLVYHQLL